MTTSEIEPATFRFVAQHLSYCVTVSNFNFNNVLPEAAGYILIKYVFTYIYKLMQTASLKILRYFF